MSPNCYNERAPLNVLGYKKSMENLFPARIRLDEMVPESYRGLFRCVGTGASAMPIMDFKVPIGNGIVCQTMPKQCGNTYHTMHRDERDERTIWKTFVT